MRARHRCTSTQGLGAADLRLLIRPPDQRRRPHETTTPPARKRFEYTAIRNTAMTAARYSFCAAKLASLGFAPGPAESVTAPFIAVPLASSEPVKA